MMERAWFLATLSLRFRRQPLRTTQAEAFLATGSIPLQEPFITSREQRSTPLQHQEYTDEFQRAELGKG